MASSLLLVGCFGIVLAIGSFATISLHNFLSLERDLAVTGLGRAKRALDRQLEGVAVKAVDYACWDETYEYIAGANAGFFEANFTDESLRNLGIDLVAAFDDAGRRIAFRTAAGYEAPADLPPRLDRNLPLFAPAVSTEPRSGVMLFGNEPYTVATLPATRSDGSGVPAGLLVFAQKMDSEFADEISELTGLRVEFAPAAPEGSYPAEPAVIRKALDAPVIGTAAYLGPDGKPAILIRTEENRSIFRSGFQSVVLIILSSILILTLTLFAGKAALTVLLVRPLKLLEESFGADAGTEDQEDSQLYKLASRFDLLGQTARVVREARSRLREAVEREHQATVRLEKEVALRTRDLSEANSELSVYKKIIDRSNEGIIITDRKGNILEANSAFCRMTGYDQAELVGKNPRIVKSDRHDAEFFAAMWRSIAQDGRWDGEIWNRKKNGTVFPQLLSINAIAGEDDRTEKYVGICVDISQLKDVEESLNRMAFYDSLTGLPNRALFNDRFAQALSRARRTGSRVALLYLDLDRFKHVNDSLGHHAGDELLRITAQRLKTQVRAADTVCRLGGDEFTVILEEITSTGDAAAIARKLISALQVPFQFGEVEAVVGTSVGIAMYPYDGTTEEELVKRADSAMYEAKERGRGQLRFASGESGTTSKRRLETESKLRRGIESGELFLLYQPQVATGGAAAGTNSGIVGAEALVRWKPPNGKVIPPDSFIQIAEETGLIVPLGNLVLNEACREAKLWADRGTPLQVSVNVSQLQFERGRIVDQVADALLASSLPPELLKLEITESLFSRDMERMIEIMQEIKKLGVRFAVDDFGTGYSSLRYIDKLPLDSLKIDKSFIQRIDSRYEGGEIATAVVSLARSFGLESIAEGVETAEQLDALRSRGCDAIQGYYVSQPLSTEEFRTFIAAQEPIVELASPE